MAELARGSVTDRPWGMTLGALGRRGLSGQLTVTTDGKPYQIAFERGAVVGAYSPLTSDAAARIALTVNLITSTQVADITRRMAAAPGRDEIEVLAELARLTPDQAQRLRRRLIAQRAARTFSLERGSFVVDDVVTVHVAPGSALDIRAVIYIGAKNNLSEDRLAAELDVLGGWFRLKQESLGELAQYGFTEAEKPALQTLVEGAEVGDIEEAHPQLGSRMIRAVTYALASCGACEVREGTRPPLTASPTPVAGSGRTAQAPVPHTMPPSSFASGGVSSGVPRAGGSPGSTGSAMPGRPRRPSMPPPGSENWVPNRSGPAVISEQTSPGSQPVGTPPSSQPVRAQAPSSQPVRAQAPSSQPVRAQAPSSQPQPTAGSSSSGSSSRPGLGTDGTGPGVPQPETDGGTSARTAAPKRGRRNTAAMREIDLLLASKVPLLDGNADHYSLLGLAHTASPDEVRQSYFMLARKLHPDRLASIGVPDDARNAQRLMAQINAAFAILNDATRRADYLAILSRGGEAVVRAEDARADEMAMRVLRAEEIFKQGEMALRRDQLQSAIEAFKQAVELQPNESEYQALLAWTQFALAPDKNALANATRKALLKAAGANERSPTARFYLGRVERMLGKEREALGHFQEVLRIKPNHPEASSEVRILEQRLKGRR